MSLTAALPAIVQGAKDVASTAGQVYAATKTGGQPATPLPPATPPPDPTAQTLLAAVFKPLAAPPPVTATGAAPLPPEYYG